MAHRDIIGEVYEFTKHEANGQSWDMPILYHRLDSFFAVYGCDFKAAVSMLPSARLKPVKIWPGRTAALLVAFNYLDTSIGPYGEFALGIPCTTQAKGSLKWGVYIHRLPVTTAIAMEAGILLWGYPKFVCDMDFKNTGAENSVKLELNGELILSLKVQKGGIPMNNSDRLSTFTVKDGQLIQTAPGTQTTTRVNFNGLARLEIGSAHAMCQDLQALGLGKKPILTGDNLDTTMVLGMGEYLGGA